MKLGYQALFDFKDAFETVEFGIENGFQCVELNQTNPSFYPEKYSPTQRERLKNYLFPILIHAPEGLSLFNLHKKVLAGTLERLYEVIDFANEIGAQRLTLHLGFTFTISVGGKLVWAHHIMAQEYANNMKDALIKLIEYAKDKVMLCIENTAGFRYEITAPIIAELLSHRQLYLTWDIGHTHRLKVKDMPYQDHPYRMTKGEEEAFFLKFIDKIVEVHLHDNHGDWDEHGVPGTGTVDFRHCFEVLKSIDPYFVIEVRPKEKAIESLRAIKKLISY